MKTLKHAPGPWNIQEVQEWLDGLPAVWPSIAMTSCFVILPANHAPALERDDEANARLIAAAPTLLETLQAIAGQRTAFKRDCDFADWAIALVEKQIANVTGENP